MPDKPTTADGYRSEQVALVKPTCLYIATKLGDIMDELVVVGGLVPSLLINQDALPEGADPHVGTMDLDIGLTLALLDNRRYKTLTERLRVSGFSQDVNEEGNPTRQRWKIEREEKVTVDFLIQPSLLDDRGGKLRNIESDFAAVIAPGLHLAFQDRERITLSGRTIMGEQAEREVWVCGAGAYVVLKALAFSLRGENKDAYDLFYLVRNYGSGVEDVVSHLRPLLDDPSTQEALNILHRDFFDADGLGPRRVAEFIRGGPNEGIQADVVGYVRRLLELCGFLG
jgi:hypothetical protein